MPPNIGVPYLTFPMTPHAAWLWSRHRAFVVNAPRGCSAAWLIVRPFLSERAQAKVGPLDGA